jgi:hypothetical protein
VVNYSTIRAIALTENGLAHDRQESSTLSFFADCGRRAAFDKSRVPKTMSENKGREFCLIVEGAYLTESEAEHALRDPFIEDWVEQTGHFKVHNMDDIQVTPGVTLGSLGVVMIDERVFEIAAVDPDHPLTEHKAKGVAEALRRQDMFDEVNIQPRDEEVNLHAREDEVNVEPSEES